MVTRSSEMRRVLSGHEGGDDRRSAEVRLVIEAGHAVVGLRFEIGADDPMLGVGREKRQSAAGNEIADERRDEDGLAGARQAGDAKTYRWRQIIAEARLRVLDEIGVGEVSQGVPCGIAMKKGPESPL